MSRAGLGPVARKALRDFDRGLRPGDRVLVVGRDVLAVVQEDLGGHRYRVVTDSAYDSGARLVRARRDLVLA